MRGWLARDAWHVTEEVAGTGFYYAERVTSTGAHESHSIKAHCLACAKADIVTKYGGRVDSRGWHKQGICGSYMRLVATTPDDDETTEER